MALTFLCSSFKIELIIGIRRRSDMKRNRVGRWSAVCLFAALLCGCGQVQPKEAETISLYDRGLAIIAKMDSIAESKEYAKLMTTSPEVLQVVEEIGSGEYSTPKAVYQVTMTEEIDGFLGDVYGDSIDGLSEELKEDFKSRILESISSMFSASGGASALAAVSLISGDDYFIDPNLSEDQLYLYVYEGGCSASVAFSVHKDGIVSAVGRFIVSDDISEALMQDKVSQWIEESGLRGLEVSEVHP